MNPAKSYANTVGGMQRLGAVLRLVTIVDDLAAATEFFVELGLELQGEGPVEGRWVDRVVGFHGVRAEIALPQTSDSHERSS